MGRIVSFTTPVPDLRKLQLDLRYLVLDKERLPSLRMMHRYAQWSVWKNLHKQAPEENITFPSEFQMLSVGPYPFSKKLLSSFSFSYYLQTLNSMYYDPLEDHLKVSQFWRSL